MPSRLPTVTRALCAALAALLAGPACIHYVRLDTTPSGASIAVNGVHVGETPVDFRETTGWEKRYDVEITKPGYEPVKDVFRQSEWDARIAVPSVAGAFCLLPLAGLLFSRRARHGYHWKLTPGGGAPPAGPAEGPQAPGGPGPDPADYPPPPPEPTDYPPPPLDD